MRWRANKLTPIEGQIRNVRKFAILPVKCGEFKVWLETYNSVQVYKRALKYNGRRGWYELEWVETDRQTLDYY